MYFRPVIGRFFPNPPKPTFDLFLTYFHVFGVRTPLGGLLLLKCSNALKQKAYHWTENHYITSRYFSELVMSDVINCLHQ